MTTRERPALWFVILVGCAVVILSHALEDTTGLSPGDEGYLWYGSLRTAAGEVPIRDFRAYDPGRYYWCAALSRVFGNGILGLRRSSGLFELVGILAGLLALTRALRSRIALGAGAVCLALWMQPVHKLFEPATALAAVWVGVRLLEKPSRARLAAAGVLTGLAAFFGRNLGLYVLLAFGSLILYLRFRMRAIPLRKSLAPWIAGIAAGYAPMIAMIAFIPGYKSSFVESVIFLKSRGGVNLPLPVPWPWKADLAGSHIQTLINLSVGTGFLLLPIVLGASVAFLLFRTRERTEETRLLTASTFVGLFFSHHAFARADLYHLAGAIPPVLVALTAWTALVPAGRWARAALPGALLAATLPAAFSGIPALHRLSAPERRYVRTDIRGDRLWVTRNQAQMLEGVRRAVEGRIAPGESILIAPGWTVLYPLLGRKAPVWDPYILWPHTAERQLAMIGDLEKNHTRWALVSPVAVDERPDLALPNSQPALWDYLVKEFEPVRVSGIGPYDLLRRRDGAETPVPQTAEPRGLIHTDWR